MDKLNAINKVMLMQSRQLIHTLAISEVRIYCFKCKIQEKKRVVSLNLGSRASQKMFIEN
jgi:hypothetical protein